MSSNVTIVGNLTRDPELRFTPAGAHVTTFGVAVNRRWQADMAPFFVDLSGGRPDRGFTLLDEVFNLEAQLDRAWQLGDDHG